nr:MAG: hypothetical protein DIU52_01100 [bacterium]
MSTRASIQDASPGALGSALPSSGIRLADMVRSPSCDGVSAAEPGMRLRGRRPVLPASVRPVRSRGDAGGLAPRYRAADVGVVGIGGHPWRGGGGPGGRSGGRGMAIPGSSSAGFEPAPPCCIVRIVLLDSRAMAPGRDQRTTLEYALIGLIRQMPRSGYELRKVFAETAMAGYSGSPGAIYPALRRLEADGLIEGSEQPDSRRRPRREYHLTPAGEAVLQEWLARPVTRDDVALRLDELMLRFAFLGYAVDSRRRTLDFLASLETHLDAFLGELEQQLEAIDAASHHVPVTHARLALEAGISSIADRLRWARAARARLSTTGGNE